MIRRTRTEIEKYYGEDMKQQGLKFPEVRDPEPLFYKFSKQENEIFDETIRLLVSEFKYARYKPLDVLRRADGTNRNSRASATWQVHEDPHGQTPRKQLPRVPPDPRTGSSHSYDRVIDEFHKGNVYISKKHINKIFEVLEDDNQEAIERLLEEDKAETAERKGFLAEFHARPQERFEHSSQGSGTLGEDQARSKMGGFREVLNAPKLKKGKLIIFTESQETASYLADRIAKEVEPKVILFTGQSSEETHKAVIANFDANAFQPARRLSHPREH